jgi:chaperonin cofactor prefoldin
MRRNGFLVGFLGLLFWSAALPARADAPDALQDAAAAALQKLDQFAIKESERVKDSARATRDLGVQLNSVAAQGAPLNDQLKNRKSELEDKIDALEEQIQKLKVQADKLDAILQKITGLMPKLMNATANDQGIEASQHILAAIVQDQTRASRLADAIERRNSDEVSGLLRRAFEGARVQVDAMPEGEGVTVNFRVGSLVHCLSAGKRCRGAAFSLGKGASRDAPDPEALLKQLQSLLTAANREAAACNKRVEDLLAKATATQGGPRVTDANRAADLQRLMGQLSTLQSTASQLSRDIAAAMDRVIART